MQTMSKIESLLPESKDFKNQRQGRDIDLYYLGSDSLHVAITNYGARIVSLLVKDKHGNWVDVVVGFSTLDGYLNANEIYHGAVIGRYANRIAKGKFKLNDQYYTLNINNGPNHLHGGPNGFHDVVWEVKEAGERHLVLHYLSKDGEEGYPGNLDLSVTYKLEKNDLIIEYKASSDKDTILNITNHAYFNLNGQGTGGIYDHELFIDANHYTPVDEALIPTGEIAPVSSTPFDFLQPKKIGANIEEEHQQIEYGNGFDHNYVLNKGYDFGLAARAFSNSSGITLEVLTDQPGIQFYTGNFMKGEHILKNGLKDEFRSAFCLETQHFPDSPNHQNFPSTTLAAGEVFSSSTIFRLY